MKKLFMWSALLMTGFAFYSCDDVVDNPAKASTSVWNYSVSVTFEEFTGLATPYQGPTTLYVFNDDMQPMGTITTETAPAAGTSATYAGTITGAIGNNLIISTTDGKEFTKQDGTLESAVKYGIIQTAKAPIKIYNANTQKITTGAAKMENKVSIVSLNLSNYATNKDKVIKFSTKDLDVPGITDPSFTITLDKEVDATGTFYVALATKSNDKFDLQLNIDATDRGYELTGLKEEAAITAGALTNFGNIDMYPSTVDLTKLWAAYKEANADAKYTSFSSFFKGAVITQSGSEAVPVELRIRADATLKNVNISLGEGTAYRALYSYNYLGEGIFIKLEGENKITNEAGYGIFLEEGTFTLTGTGSLAINSKSTGAYISNSYNPWTDSNGQKRYSALKIDKDVTLSVKSTNSYGIYIPDNDTLSVINGATIIAEGAENSVGIATQNAQVIIGEGAKVTAKAGKNGQGINSGAAWDVKKGATIKAYGGKDGRGIDIWNSGTNKFELGENVTIEAYGAPSFSDDALGQGMKVGANITLGKGTTIKATGADRYGLCIYGTTTIDIAEGATIEAIDAQLNAIEIESGNVTIKGKGKLIANEAKKNGINIQAGTLTLDGAEVEAKGGANNAAILATGNLAVTANLVKLTATAGTGSTICISKADAEAKKEDIGTADDKKFNDAVKDGVRTITPIPAEE